MSLNAMFAERDAGIAAADARIQAELSRAWDDCGPLQAALTRLECFDVGDRYFWDRSGEIAAGVDCPVTIEARERDYFESYLSDRCAYWDSEHDVLYAYTGPCLLIEEDGDVFDQDGHKTVIRASEYQSDYLDVRERVEVRNALIEAYMQRTGIYPGVFRADRHGNLFPVNTQPKA